MNTRVLPGAFLDPGARWWLLTGDDWAPWFEQAVRGARESVYLSIYMISHHWRSPYLGRTNLIDALEAPARRGVQCRGIIDQPNVQGRREPFNVKAALALERAGWKMRKVPDARTLHEKILLIDRHLTTVGSHNISKASVISNYDTTLAVDSTILGERIFRQFWQRWRIAAPITAR